IMIINHDYSIKVIAYSIYRPRGRRNGALSLYLSFTTNSLQPISKRHYTSYIGDSHMRDKTDTTLRSIPTSTVVLKSPYKPTLATSPTPSIKLVKLVKYLFQTEILTPTVELNKTFQGHTSKSHS
ncbi:unnamed protein product, partial [Vicia faba]